MHYHRKHALERYYNSFTKGKPDECWNWTGKLDGYGYGVCNINRLCTAYRVAIWLDGKDPKGHHVLHSCDNPKCVNPNHLRLGTNEDNMKDKMDKQRQTKGSDVHSAVLTEKDIPVIKEKYKQGQRQYSIAAEYGVHQSQISMIVRGKTWAHVT